MNGRSRFAIGVGTGLTIGFLALIVIVGTTIWLVERGNRLLEQSAMQRSTRIAAEQLRDHLRTAGVEPARLSSDRQPDLSGPL